MANHANMLMTEPSVQKWKYCRAYLSPRRKHILQERKWRQSSQSLAQPFLQNLESFSVLALWRALSWQSRSHHVCHMAAPLLSHRMRLFGDNHLLSLGSDIWEVDGQQPLARTPGSQFAPCLLEVDSQAKATMVKVTFWTNDSGPGAPDATGSLRQRTNDSVLKWDFDRIANVLCSTMLAL